MTTHESKTPETRWIDIVDDADISDRAKINTLKEGILKRDAKLLSFQSQLKTAREALEKSRKDVCRGLAYKASNYYDRLFAKHHSTGPDNMEELAGIFEKEWIRRTALAQLTPTETKE